MITSIFDEISAAAISDLFSVVDTAMVGCKISGEERLTVLREIAGGTYEPLTINGITIQLSKYNNEVCLQGPKNYKLQHTVDTGPVSAWYEE